MKTTYDTELPLLSVKRLLFIRSALFSFVYVLFLTCSNGFAQGLPFELPQVDIVYTWVDGQDPEWIKVRNEWASKEGKAQIGSDAHSDARFRDNQELRYSLRSLNQFVPFVRHIYIVTCGQRPKWLKDHPKISFVTHEEFFKNKSHLPTFNSHAIESNLHRIKNLSEHYIYMNDDFFFGREVSFEDFYSPNGDKVKIYLSKKQKMVSEKPSSKDSGYRAANKNTSCLLDSVFGKKKRYTHTHTPYPQIKSLVNTIEAMFPQIFELDSSHRFRSLHDYTLTNGLIPYTAYYLKRAEIGGASFMTINYGKDFKQDKERLRTILEKRVTFFCLNDSPGMNTLESLKLVESFLKVYFSTPAPWEEIPEVTSEKGITRQSEKAKESSSHKEKRKQFDRIAAKIEAKMKAKKRGKKAK